MLPTLITTQMSTGLANFLSGGLGSFAFWGFAIPADNIKKLVPIFLYCPVNGGC